MGVIRRMEEKLPRIEEEAHHYSSVNLSLRDRGFCGI